MNFKELAIERHSALNFVENIEIPEQDLKDIYEMVKLSPSVFNLQPAKFLIITDKELKEQLYELNYRQYKLHTASAIVLVLANKEFPLEAENIYAPMKMLGMLDELEFKTLMENIQNTFANYTEQDLQLEAEKNSMVALTSWLYASKEIGWDSCPMHINNYDAIKALLNIPDKFLPVAMISMGKSYEKERKRGFRKPFSQGCSINKF